MSAAVRNSGSPDRLADVTGIGPTAAASACGQGWSGTRTPTVGAPLVSGAKVKATVVSHGRGDKVKIFKMRRRKHHQKSQGHRQNYTEVRIDEITG